MNNDQLQQLAREDATRSDVQYRGSVGSFTAVLLVEDARGRDAHPVSAVGAICSR